MFAFCRYAEICNKILDFHQFHLKCILSLTQVVNYIKKRCNIKYKVCTDFKYGHEPVLSITKVQIQA